MRYLLPNLREVKAKDLKLIVNLERLPITITTKHELIPYV